MKKSVKVVGDPEFQSQGNLHVWDRNFSYNRFWGLGERWGPDTVLRVFRCNTSISTSVDTVQKIPTWLLVQKRRKESFQMMYTLGRTVAKKTSASELKRSGRQTDAILGPFQHSELGLTSAKFCLNPWEVEMGNYWQPLWSFHIWVRCEFLRHSSWSLCLPIEVSKDTTG